jgi:hypothetical protein
MVPTVLISLEEMDRRRNAGPAVQWGAWFETDALLDLNTRTLQKHEDLLEHVCNSAPSLVSEK